MKLFATITSERQSKFVTKGGNEFLRIELNHKNNRLGQLEIKENQSGDIVFEWFDYPDYTLNKSNRIIKCIKGKTQKEAKCTHESWSKNCKGCKFCQRDLGQD